MFLSPQRHYHGPGCNQYAAEDGRGIEFFSQQEPRKDHHQWNAELVERRDARRWPQLQGAKVAEPRQSRGNSRKRKKKQGAAIERTHLAVLAQSERDAPCKDD